MGSLQEQLLKAGIVDKNKAKQIRTDKRKKTRQKPKGTQLISDSSNPVQYAQAKKQARDRKISHQQHKAAELRAVAAQIRQLIESHRIDREEGGTPFQFMDGKKIKKIYVTPQQQARLIKGLIAIVKQGGSYELVPADVAEKIRQRDGNRVLAQNTAGEEKSVDDDPYADYKIPDDLIW